MPRVSTTPRVKIVWITGRDILMPVVPVLENTRATLRRGIIHWSDGRSTSWVKENEYDVFRLSLERYFSA